MSFPSRFKEGARGLGIGVSLACATASTAAFAADTPEGVDVTDQIVHQNNIGIGLSTSVREMEGKFDAWGNYASYPADSSSWAAMTMFTTSYRLNSSWEAGLGFMARDSATLMPTGSMRSFSIGSPSLSVRYHTKIADGWAHLIAHLGVGAPYSFGTRTVVGDVSRSMPQSQTDLADGTFGGWGVRVGLGFAKSFTFLPIRVAIDSSVTNPFPQSSDPDQLPPGTPVSTSTSGRQYSLSEGISYEIGRQWAVNTGIRQSWGGDTYTNGIDDVGTASRMFSSSIGASYIPDAHWRWNVSYSTQWPFYNYLINQGYSPAISLGMGYTGI
jgi:hypothetical protein